jgi:uncharacterized protein
METSIEPSAASAIATEASGLGAFEAGGANQTLAALRRLGAVQIDTISVVERAHHHALWTRNALYQAAHLPELEGEPRLIIEYWTHAAAYLPIEEYRFCIPRMERIRSQGHEWFDADPRTVAIVRDTIRAEGPMRAQDFEGKRGPGGWWDWKPAKRALEYLFQAGELVSLGRRGFQKVYDLPERALPAGLDLRPPTTKEMAAHYIDRASESLGIFAASDIAYMRKDGLGGISDELAGRVEDGRLARMRIAGDSRDYYAAASAIGRRRRRAAEARAFVLSPFDPLIIDRKRTARLFGRAYQLECYLPASKRTFGYFGLPLLFVGLGAGPAIAGLLDAKADRRDGRLVLRRLYLDAPPTDAGGRRVGSAEYSRIAAEAIGAFAAFNGAATIELQAFESSDGRLERSLRAAIPRASKRIKASRGRSP